jgi:hypothetical protein
MLVLARDPGTICVACMGPVLEYLRHEDVELMQECRQLPALRREFEFYNLTWRPDVFEGWWHGPVASLKSHPTAGGPGRG